MSNKVIAKTLGIELTETKSVEIEPVTEEEEEELDIEFIPEDEVTPEDIEGAIDVVGELVGTELPIGHVEEDYAFTRQKMRSFLSTGEEALAKVTEMVNNDQTARGYEVVSTMLKTVSDMATSFFDLQKRNKELHQGSLGAVGTKGTKIDMNNGIVFTGDSATVLEQLKLKKKQEKDGGV